MFNADKGVPISLLLELVVTMVGVPLAVAAYLAIVSQSRLPNKTFGQRLSYVFWRFALPACAIASALCWFFQTGIR
ncbi:MAG: hypothetical protein WCE87_10605 [Candidatus Udaeobacter sp.]